MHSLGNTFSKWSRMINVYIYNKWQSCYQKKIRLQFLRRCNSLWTLTFHTDMPLPPPPPLRNERLTSPVAGSTVGRWPLDASLLWEFLWLLPSWDSLCTMTDQLGSIETLSSCSSSGKLKISFRVPHRVSRSICSDIVVQTSPSAPSCSFFSLPWT